MSKIYPVLLAGGSGTRLWPVSRKSYPKQFSKLIQEKSLFQACAERLATSKKIEFAPHITMTNSDYRFIVVEQLKEINLEPASILIEPSTKNTAPAVLAASLFAASENEDAVLLVAPSDHVIPETDDFHDIVNIGIKHAFDGKIVTFGIKPNRPESGFGYLELEAGKLDDLGTSKVKNFIEKPDPLTASEMIKNGNYLWNAGIFLFQAKKLIREFEIHVPEMVDLVRESLFGASPDLNFLRLAPEPWAKIQEDSIDYAVMEKTQSLVAIPYTSKWSDLGGWDAVWAECEKDSVGNVLSEAAHSIDCEGTLLRSESMNQQIVGVGLRDILAIAMPDAVLVAHKDKAQHIKSVVETLKIKNVSQAESFPVDYRPWGSFKSLVLDETFQVKHIAVKPGAALSLQSHNYRSEHWIIVYGTATVTIGDKVQQVAQGESVFIPVGAKHRLENSTKEILIIIEVQTGTYFGEDDITRYQDQYNRINN